jgi:hypothetical protein
MTEYTKVNVRKDLMPQVKIRAAAENRTITNYIETLIIKDLTPKETK